MRNRPLRQTNRPVVVINDSPELLARIAEVLREDEGYAVRTLRAEAADVTEVVAQRPALILVDLLLPTDASDVDASALEGWDLLGQILDEPALDGIPVVVMSAAVEALREHEPALQRRPQLAILHKPFSVHELTATVDALLGG